jgi:hypothetical protein
MKEIIAIEAFGTPYMTQNRELPINERVYVSKIKGGAISENDWRGATTEEKETWQKEMEALNNLNIENYESSRIF